MFIYKSQISGERLQDHWSSGFSFSPFYRTVLHVWIINLFLILTDVALQGCNSFLMKFQCLHLFIDYLIKMHKILSNMVIVDKI